MQRRVFALVALAASLVTLPTMLSADEKNKAGLLTVPVTARETNGTRTFAGTLAIQKFAVVGNGVNAIGILSMNLPTGVAVSAVSVPLELPSATKASSVTDRSALAVAPGATCEILRLVLGPLHLELLGLQIDLNRVVLEITAQSGGGLLGDLLCAVANLLNGTNLSGLLQSLVDALNNLLGALAGL